MIPRAHITAWRATAPWSTDAQVEQDLVISRSIVEIFSDPRLAQALAFRGGTALHKLFFSPAARYSEDIDLVQVEAGPIKPTLIALRERLAWLGDAKAGRSGHSTRLEFRFDSTMEPVQRLRLKVEVHGRDHGSVLGFEQRRFAVQTDWFSGEAEVKTYTVEELLGTKLRALYQRKKGRDLFDLALALSTGAPDQAKVVDCFLHYLECESRSVSRAQFEKNLHEKAHDRAFLDDLKPLLAEPPPGDGGFGSAAWGSSAWGGGGPSSARTVDLILDAERRLVAWPVAIKRVRALLLTRLPGEPWKGWKDP